MDQTQDPRDDLPSAESDVGDTSNGPAPEDVSSKKAGRRRSRYYRSKTEDAPAVAVAEVAAPAGKPVPKENPPEAGAADGRGGDSHDADGGSPTEVSRPEGTQDDQGHGGYYQGRGGFDPFYFKKGKRHKRKRGKHWPPGGGNLYPPQPPPPSFGPVFGDLPDPARFADVAALDEQARDIASGGGKSINLEEIYELGLPELTEAARKAGAEFDGAPNRKELLAALFKAVAIAKRAVVDHGWLDLTDRGHGFLVHKAVQYRLYPEDAYVPESLIKRYSLKRGHELDVQVRSPEGNERCPSVVKINKVMGGKPEDISKVTPFEDLIPHYPLKTLLLHLPPP